MENISIAQANRVKESENKRHQSDIQKLKTQNSATYQRAVRENNKHVERLEKEFDADVSNIKNEHEQKLIKIRKKHSEIMAIEQERLEAELNNLRSSHEDKKTEIRVAQQHEINEMETSHRETLDRSRDRFLKEKMKWDA